MRIACIRTLVLVIVIGFGSTSRTACADEPPETPFQQTANSLVGGCMLQLMEYGHFPHFTSWSRMKGDFGAEQVKLFTSFPNDLIAALGNRDSADHQTAIFTLAAYTSYARSHADMVKEKNLARAVERALAPHTERIRQGLVASLHEREAKIRVFAALTLLNLDESDAEANEVFKACAASAEEFSGEVCPLLGVARVTSPQVIEYLQILLKHRKLNLRQDAVSAIITMGPAARELAPALVVFLATGEDAKGAYRYPLAIALPHQCNLALLAIDSLEQHGRPAVPAILRRFPNATKDDQLAMLACLASIGCKDDACVALVRKTLESTETQLQVTAACTLLYLAPNDPRAISVIKKALAETATRKVMFEIFCKLGPPSRDITASLVPFLEDEKEETRISATLALARIGPSAAESVPRLENLLVKEENPELGTATTHTFQSTRAAAYALAQIRSKDAAAALLRVANMDVGGAHYAIMYLTEFGDDLPAETLPVLAKAIQNDQHPVFPKGPLSSAEEAALMRAAYSEDRKFMAAIALSNLGERARAVRGDLEKLHDDPDIGWIVDTALRRMAK